DWSSDVCSSDLPQSDRFDQTGVARLSRPGWFGQTRVSGRPTRAGWSGRRGQGRRGQATAIFVLLRAPPSSQPSVSRSLVQRAPAYSTRLSPYSSACATHQVAISQPRLRLVTAVLPSARLSARSALAFSGRGGAACLPPSGPAACG